MGATPRGTQSASVLGLYPAECCRPRSSVSSQRGGRGVGARVCLVSPAGEELPEDMQAALWRLGPFLVLTLI